MNLPLYSHFVTWKMHSFPDRCFEYVSSDVLRSEMNKNRLYEGNLNYIILSRKHGEKLDSTATNLEAEHQTCQWPRTWMSELARVKSCGISGCFSNKLTRVYTSCIRSFLIYIQSPCSATCKRHFSHPPTPWNRISQQHHFVSPCHVQSFISSYSHELINKYKKYANQSQYLLESQPP